MKRTKKIAHFKAGFYRSFGFVAGLLLLIPPIYLFAQSLNSFSEGDLVSASRINANFQLLNNGLTIAAPDGAIVPFMLAACPTGWVPADGTGGTPDLRGRFVRGRDDAGTGAAGVDPSGVRAVGNIQTDAFQGHHHAVSGHQPIWRNFVPGAANAINPGGVDSPQTLNVVNPISDGANGAPRYTSETRPVNVALIYCMRRS